MVGNATTKFFCLKCFLMALQLLCLRIWFGCNFNMSSWLSSLCWFGCILIYTYIGVLSSTTFTYSYDFMFESFDLSECDRTLTTSVLIPQILSIQIICILLKLSIVFSESLSAEDTETKIESVLMLYPYCLKPGEAGSTTRQSRRAWEHGTTSNVLHECHVSFRCEPPGAPV